MVTNMNKITMARIGTFVAAIAAFVSVATAFQFPDCKNGPMSTFPICNQALPIQDRAADYLSRLTLAERLSRLDSSWANGSIAIPRLGVGYYQWINDALHGLTAGVEIKFANGNVPFNSSTSFPEPINFAATFDDMLAYGEGHTIGVEARAFSNVGRAGLDLWTPNINLFRDPRWGRGMEVPGEDPLVVSRYAAAFVEGMQTGDDPRYWLAAANCKHYAAYDVEDWHGNQRYGFNAVASLKELVEYFLPSFKACVQEGKAASVMCSYNALNGIPTCGDSWLLQTLLKDTWHFDPNGFVTSDCDAVQNIYDSHHYTKTPEEAVALGLSAGTDTDCGSYYNEHLYAAYNQSLVTDAEINRSVMRLTSSLLRLGYFDDPSTQVYRQYGIEHVNTPEAQRLAERVAEDSIVLLKNDNNILPISPKLSVALIGPFGDDPNRIQGNYQGKPSSVVTYLQGLSAIGASVSYAMGCTTGGNDTSGFAAAIALASKADVTIFVGGIDTSVEAEGNDRTTIIFPGVQLQLIQQLETASKALIVATVGGGQVDTSYIKASKMTQAILWVGYGSQSAGTAFANIIYGRNSPAGRLPVTQYIGEYVNQVNMTDMSLRPHDGTPGRTYMFYTGTPVFEFGYGMSYTTFSYDWVGSLIPSMSINQVMNQAAAFGGELEKAPFAIPYYVNVTNTGKVTSDNAVLLFVTSDVPDAPMARLVDYTRLRMVKAGETRTVYFTPYLREFTTVDEKGDRYLEPATYSVWVGTSRERHIVYSVTLTGTRALVTNLPPPPRGHPLYTAQQ